MDYSLLSDVVAELSRSLTDARVERVIQGIDRDVYLLFRKGRKNFILLLSPRRSLPRMHLVSRKPQASRDPHPIVLNLRSRLAGSRLTHIYLLNLDRIVEMAFEKGNASYRLFLELTGYSSNLVFADRELKILAIYYPIPISVQASRIILPGGIYMPPPKKAQNVPMPSGFDIDASGSPNIWSENHYMNIVRQQKLEALKLKLRSLITRLLNKMERKRTALIADLQDMLHADDYRQKGDILLVHLKQLVQGIDQADLVGYDGTSVSVRLDPKRSPTQNAELYFKKYKKAKTGLPLIQQRLDETKQEIHRLKLMLTDIEHDDDLDSLNHLHSTLTEIGRTENRASTKGRSASGTVAGVKSISYCGWEILVGRSAAGNDYLTTKIANNDDLWLHAEGMPGSHVIVRNPHNAEIPPVILLKAASLAALYSKGKKADKVLITYTKARFVRKPRGAKPGLVTLSQRKTIIVKPAVNPQK